MAVRAAAMIRARLSAASARRRVGFIVLLPGDWLSGHVSGSLGLKRTRVHFTGKRFPMTGISGKVVAVTGASSGIGEATARLLAERGAAVVLGARRAERLDKLAQQIRDDGGRAISRATDVTRREDLRRLADAAVAEFGRLDVLVSNAGVSKIGPMADLDVDGWQAMIDVNL